jgi:predicted nucleic acid-binding protein
MRRVFCDTSVLVRYFAEDDIPRAAAAAQLIESDSLLVVSTGVLIELVHALRTQYGIPNPHLARLIGAFLLRSNVELSDADVNSVVTALQWSTRVSARRIPDAIVAAAAERAGCEVIVSFDEKFASPSVPVRLL